VTTPTSAPVLRGSQGRIFYGWYIIGISMVGGFMAAGTSQLFMGVMLKPMTEDLGWTRTETSGAITLGTLFAGLISPGAGWLTDRYGPRFLAPSCALIVVGAFFFLSNLNSLWQFYVAYIIGRGFSSSILAGVVPLTLATNWFRRYRGRAMGLVSMALPLGGSLLALVGQLIIESSGWRSVFTMFGIALLVLYVVPALFLIRRRPEDVGLLPDGATFITEDPDSTSPTAYQPEVSWTLKQAIRTRALWLLIAGLWFGLLANGAIGFHLVAYYSDKGISATTAATALSVYGFTGALANGLWGLLVERVSERVLAVFAMSLSAASVLFLLTVDAIPQAFVFAFVFGLAARGESSLIMMMVAQYYGRGSYGTINGFITPFQMLGLGLGPLVASISYDLSGSYDNAFFLFAAFFAIAAAALWFARRPALPVGLKAALN
jgi:MFS family permease